MKTKIEILAPAGSWESLEAAVFTGADAVYFAGTSFGARAGAKNFAPDELEQAVKFCRARGVKSYITVNTLIKNSEIREALNFVKFLCDISVDGVIIQDMGLYGLLRKYAPDLTINGSTQMSVHSLPGARLLEKTGAKRVVLARELSLKEISEISGGTQIELESFVHGALCMCVSGQCYLSAMLGGRSGNRGMCAQPCRLPFSVKGGTGNDLSLKDLSFISGLERLSESGVCSAKIEGRMKRPEYVAAAVSASRSAVDKGEVSDKVLNNLQAVFSRSGFTSGYLKGKLGKEMFGTRTKDDVAGASGKILAELRNLYKSEMKRVPVSLELMENEKIILTAKDDAGREVSVEYEGAVAENKLSAQRCEQQLSKTGGTPFLAKSVKAPESRASLNVSALNSLRRQALEELLKEREQALLIKFDINSAQSEIDSYNRRSTGKMKLRASFKNIEQMEDYAKAFDKIYLPLFENEHKIKKYSDKIIFEIPRAIFGSREDGKIRKRILELKEKGHTDFSCGNLGAVEICRELGVNAHGTCYLNILNSAALNYFKELGLSSAELSYELSGREISGICSDMERGIMVYGRQALMLTRNCPAKNGSSKEAQFLTDRKGIRFPMDCSSGQYTELLNSVALYLGDLQDDIKNVDFGVLRFTVESCVECESITNHFLKQEKPEFDITRGLFNRGIR